MTSRSLFVLLIGLASCAEPSNATVKKCVDECDAASDCPGGTGDCLDVCESEYLEAERIQCVPEYQGIVDCLAASNALCDPAACATELSTYTICLGAYCGTERSTFRICFAKPEGLGGAGGGETCTEAKDTICPAPPGGGTGGGGVGGGG